MSGEKHDYTQYMGLPKEDRRNRIAETASESLETRRFMLSTNPELKDRIKLLHGVVEELKKQYPEVVSLNLFGSLTKGYAHKESDFDAKLFIDSTKESKDPSHVSAYNEFVKAVQKATETSNPQVDHILLKVVSLEEITERAKNTSGEDFLLRDLFLLAIGRDINQYREIVLNTLESKGYVGELIWQNIMHNLWLLENTGFPDELKEKRKKLYPQTLAEGRRIFLQEK